MIVEGGEYIGENAVWSDQGAIYNPVTNAWAPVAPPPGWTNIGDSASDVLANGTFILQHPCNTCATNPDLTVDDALLNAKNLTWKVIPATGKNDPNDEEGWTLEPSGQLLTLDVWGVGSTQLFNPTTDTWSFSGATVPNGNPVNPFPIVEIGPQVEMPGGNAFVVGAGSSTQEAPSACTTDAGTQTALYQYKAGTAGTWTAGPEIPAINGEEYPPPTARERPCRRERAVRCERLHLQHADSLLRLQRRLEHAEPGSRRTERAERHLVCNADAGAAQRAGAVQRRQQPDGGVHSGRSPNTGWEPSISSISANTLAPGSTYSLSGKQLAGLDQGAAYGDDVQDNTNFPLVRITNSSTGVVTYARTANWSSVSVAPAPAPRPSSPSPRARQQARARWSWSPTGSPHRLRR